MKRAQGIKKAWEQSCSKDTGNSMTAPLKTIIDLQYQKYLSLCHWCYENPLPLGEWLCEEIPEKGVRL